MRVGGRAECRLMAQADYLAMPPVRPLYPQQQTLVRGRRLRAIRVVQESLIKRTWGQWRHSRTRKKTDNSSKTKNRTGVGLLSEVPDEPTPNRVTLMVGR